MTASLDPSCDDDLVAAREIARRLRRERVDGPSAFAPSTVNAIDGEHGFASLRAAMRARDESAREREVCVGCVGLVRPPPKNTLPVVETPSESVPDLPFDLHAIESTGASAWNKLLAWATHDARAHGACVTDRDGLLIATQGDALSLGGFDAIAPHMIVAFSQLPKLGEPALAAQWAQIHFGAERVLAIRFETHLAGEVLLVLLSRADFAPSSIERVIEATRAFVRRA